MDAKEFFELMQQARQEAKKSIPLTKRAQQIVPVKCIAAITAAKAIAATHNVLAKVLPNKTSLSSDTAQQRASRLLSEYYHSFITDIPYAKRQNVDVMYVNICATEGFVEGEKLFYQRLEGHPMIDSMKKITNILKNEMEIFLTHSSMEALTKPSGFWRVLGTNPQWSSTVKEFRKEWDNHRTHWQNTARQDLASLRVETHSEPKLSSLIVSAASILHTRLKKSAQPNRDTKSVQRFNR